jgi:hypothetical protein
VNERAAIGATVVIALLAAALDVGLAANAFLHAGLLAAVCIASGLTAWHGLHLVEAAPTAAAVPAAWTLSYHAPAWALAAGLVVAALAWTGRADRHWEASVAAVGVAGIGYAATVNARVAIAGAAITAFAVLVRPSRPTAGQLAFLRGASLLGPGLLLLAAMGTNAATGVGDGLATKRVLAVGLALTGLAAMLGWAGLGLTTLLESGASFQRVTWTGMAAGLALPLGIAVLADPSRVIDALPATAVPMSVLAAVTAARVRREHDAGFCVALVPLILLLTMQLGF